MLVVLIVFLVLLAMYIGMFLLKARRIVEEYKEREGTDTLGALMDSPELAELFIKAFVP